ncbi:hypothetical protein ACFORJ_01130 [Corynebacterium hansenii]|uniref:Uncharacterized protein n=1 Tax=Corynebacterium hansenii TaxID=394964 RepID=A0ABV7ZJP5_9CORY|nr:hypothetical protein [Corynebacterium hansenii]WJY99393.1 hypothetical protein CHAN_03850 [Corynebacterium hansenii]
MEWFEEHRRLELTERNITTLLAKLDDPKSWGIIVPAGHQIRVRAVESAYPATVAEELSNGDVLITREQLVALSTEGASVHVEDITVVSVSDAAHYCPPFQRGVHAQQ